MVRTADEMIIPKNVPGKKSPATCQAEEKEKGDGRSGDGPGCVVPWWVSGRFRQYWYGVCAIVDAIDASRMRAGLNGTCMASQTRTRSASHRRVCRSKTKHRKACAPVTTRRAQLCLRRCRASPRGGGTSRSRHEKSERATWRNVRYRYRRAHSRVPRGPRFRSRDLTSAWLARARQIRWREGTSPARLQLDRQATVYFL